MLGSFHGHPAYCYPCARSYGSIQETADMHNNKVHLAVQGWTITLCLVKDSAFQSMPQTCYQE